MTSAIFGLVGVVIGALMSGGVEAWNDRRRRKAELRQAIRLVADDLRGIHADLELLLELREWPTMNGHFLTTEAWETHKSALAREIDDERWLGLSSLFGTVPFIRMRATLKAGESMGADEVEELREGAEHFADLLNALTDSP